MATTDVDSVEMSCAVTGFLIDRYSTTNAEATGGIDTGTVMRLFLSTPAAATATNTAAAGSSPGGPTPTQAFIYFTDQKSRAIFGGKDAQIGLLEEGDPGSFTITAVLPPGEFDLWWEILRHAQPATLSCTAVKPDSDPASPVPVGARGDPPVLTHPQGPGEIIELHVIGGIGAPLPPPGRGITDRGGDTGRTSAGP